MHQLGSFEGVGGRNEEAGDGAGVLIAPGTHAVTVTNTKIHNIYGVPVQVLTPAEYGDPSRAAPVDLSIDAELFQEDQEKWW